MGNYASKGDAYTISEANKKFALMDDTYTKPEIDTKFAPVGLAYTKPESDSKFAPFGSSYTKDESDLKLKDYAYSKPTSDERFALKEAVNTLQSKLTGDVQTLQSNFSTFTTQTLPTLATKQNLVEAANTLQPKGNYAIAGASFTKSESDAKYTPAGSAFTKAESDAKYSFKGDAFTKAESDTKYAPAGFAFTKAESDAKYSFKGDAFTKAESDAKYSFKNDAFTKAESDGRFFMKKGAYDLSVGDGVANDPRGDSGASRALVKDAGSTLAINYSNDYKGGVRVDSAMTVKGALNVDGVVNSGGAPLAKVADLQPLAPKDTVYTKADTDGKINAAVTAVNQKLTSMANSNTLLDIKPSTVWCADGDLCKLPPGKRGIDWGYGASKIYDDAQLKIESDDNIFMRVADDDVANFTKDNVFVYKGKALQFGQGYTREMNAGQISYGRHDGGQDGTLNIVGAGKDGQKRRVRVWDTIQLGGWTLNADDGHLRFFFNGDQKFVVHNSGEVWSQGDGGWFKDFIRVGAPIAIRSGRNNNMGLVQGSDATGVGAWEALRIERR